MKAFQAYAKGNKVTANTPKAAAQKFFDTFPTRRKCNIVQGKTDGHFFVVTYGRVSTGERPYSAKDVTKAMINTLEG